MCELAGVPLERYEQAQHKVDERQSEHNRLECTVKSSKDQASKISTKVTGIRKQLANIDKKIASLKGEASASECESADSDSNAEEYVPGQKRKFPIGSSSQSKRRRKSDAAEEDSDSDFDIPGFGSEDDAGSDEDQEGSKDEDAEMALVPGAAETLTQEAALLSVELKEKLEEVKGLRAQQTYYPETFSMHHLYVLPSAQWYTYVPSNFLSKSVSKLETVFWQERYISGTLLSSSCVARHSRPEQMRS